eukprot:273415-Alexandrium_andersonii.AAC.1
MAEQNILQQGTDIAHVTAAAYQLGQWQKDSQREEALKQIKVMGWNGENSRACLLYTSPSPRD